MKTIIINGDRLAHLKDKMEASDMTSNIWGAEFADGAYDYKSSEITFKVAEKYDDGKLKLIDISNDGYPLSIKNLDNRFLRFPTTVFDYTPGMIGCRGSGTKLTAFRVGYFEYIDSYDEESGKSYTARLIPCTDRDGEYKYQIDDNVFIKNDFKEKVNSIRVDIEFYEKDADTKGLKYGVRWFSDADIEFKEDKIKRWLSVRYSQTNNFKIYFEDVTKNGKTLRNLVPKTHLGVLKSGKPVYEYTDLKLHDDLIEVDGREFELYYGCRISKVSDARRHKKLTGLTKGEYQIKSLRKIRGESPLVVHLNNTDIVNYIEHWPTTEFNNTNSWMIYVLKPKTSINDVYASNKSSGYSDEKFSDNLSKKVKQIVKDNKIKNNYHDAQKKQENSEVEQFVEYICDSESTEIQKDFKSLLGVKDKSLLTKKKNWILFKDDESNREIDAKNPKVRVAFEFQSSKDNSDPKHMDGIASRINLVGRGMDSDGNSCDLPYDTFIWVAKKHNHYNELLKLLKGFEWGDNHLKQVVFLTSEEILDSFDSDEVLKIDIEKDVL